ncbi:MAG: Spy/CpxP family protein refolding chaperone [Sulfurovum sp.]|nr:Spy/CpxP family protein refolding chaperone [Sulfurovum sp.]
MKTLKVLTIVAITGLVGATSVYASPFNAESNKMCQKNKEHRNGMKEIFKKLDLTPEQKSAMKENRQAMREQMKEKRSRMNRKRGMADMSEFVSANGFDKQSFVEKATQKAQMRIDMRADRFEKTMNILTPEQRVKFVILLQETQK